MRSIGPRHDIKCANIKINNQDLLWVNEIRYLGIYDVRSSKLVFSGPCKTFLFPVSQLDFW